MRVNPCYLNIETIPPVGTRPGPEWVKITGNVTKPETIAAHKADPARQLEGWGNQAKDPWRAQVFCITVLPEEQEAPLILYGMEERLLLEQFSVAIAQRKLETKTGIEWVTFNGLKFDFLLIRMRAIKYRLTALAKEFTLATRYGDGTHKDLFPALGGEGKLDEWAEFFGIHNENHKGFTGGDIPAALRDGREAALTAHIRSRVTVLREINRLWGYL